mmetsp:Transcript_17080/g.23742  ORF Transcript_17080/g.23742 Transcript_17080/m.23742 type:complete len:428 (-) Transcript_17080:260-1543(-)
MLNNNKQSTEQLEDCKNLLAQTEMFQKVPPTDLTAIANLMKYRVLAKNDVLLEQGATSDRLYLMKKGEAVRHHIDEETGREQTVEFAIKAVSINSMRCISGGPIFATTKCISDECKVYELMRSDFLSLLRKKPEIGIKIAEGLCEEIRSGSRKYATPFFQQQQQDVNIPAVTIAAGIESYYRSGMNAVLNQRLTGVKAEWFPQMHIQVPTRIAYMCGLKWLRVQSDKHIDPDAYAYPQFVRLGAAFAPGILMTPVSSVLEAANAGHMNNESMTTRWMRGIVPRCGREIIFGIGLNQMSDYFEERLQPHVHSNVMANALGSLSAGVVSGYLSHVPHNLSTFKLLEPQKSYLQLYKAFVDKSVPPAIDKMVEHWPSTTKTVTRTVFATLLPRGVMIRTIQIVGSFMLLNGTINYLHEREHKKIQQALGT